MSFKSYAQTIQTDGRWMLSSPQALTFSCKDGLIARFIAREKARAATAWKLSPDELHGLASPADPVRERVIVFQQADGGGLELMWLQNVRGISAETTEMLFSFTPLTVDQLRPFIVVKVPNASCSYGEDLTLDGGVSNPNGTWKWKKPHLALGGVKLGPPVPLRAGGQVIPA